MKKITKKLNDGFRAAIPESQVIIDVEQKIKFWKEFCYELKGEFKLKRTTDNTFSRLEMNIPYKDSIISFSESDINLLRIEYPFKEKMKFSFQITFEDFLDRIIKLFNNKEIEIGDQDFDDKYLIVTNNRKTLVDLLSNKRIKELMKKLDASNFQLKKKGKNSVLFMLGGRHIDSKDELYSIFEILKISIDFIHNLNNM